MAANSSPDPTAMAAAAVADDLLVGELPDETVLLSLKTGEYCSLTKVVPGSNSWPSWAGPLDEVPETLTEEHEEEKDRLLPSAEPHSGPELILMHLFNGQSPLGVEAGTYGLVANACPPSDAEIQGPDRGWRSGTVALCGWVAPAGVYADLRVGVQRDGGEVAARAWLQYAEQVRHDAPRAASRSVPLTLVSSRPIDKVLGAVWSKNRLLMPGTAPFDQTDGSSVGTTCLSGTPGLSGGLVTRSRGHSLLKPTGFQPYSNISLFIWCGFNCESSNRTDQRSYPGQKQGSIPMDDHGCRER